VQKSLIYDRLNLMYKLNKRSRTRKFIHKVVVLPYRRRTNIRRPSESWALQELLELNKLVSLTVVVAINR
jgi:hypothetical protein